VHDGLHAAQCGIQRLRVADVAGDLLAVHAGQVRGVTGRVVVQNPDLVPAGDQPPDQCGPHETGSARYQNSLRLRHGSQS